MSPKLPFPSLRIDPPLGYGPIEPLRRDAWVRLLPPGQVPAMAATLQAVPIVPDEFAEVAAHYPIVLLRGAEDSLVPVALLGLRPGRNPFAIRTVRTTRWAEGVYVPAYLRRWPLCTAAPAAADGVTPTLTVCVEIARQTSGALSGSTRLFNSDGVPNERGQPLIQWLHDYETGLVRAREMAAAWRQAGIVGRVEWSHPATPLHKAVRVQGLWGVDPAALAALGREAAYTLHEQRAMAGAHLAAESASRFSHLYERTFSHSPVELSAIEAQQQQLRDILATH
jgi:hypothetical protein